MSHPFGDLLSRYLHRKHGLSQARLAAAIGQPPFVVSLMSRGERLMGGGASSGTNLRSGGGAPRDP